ncbi:MAG: sigma-70 family RNA polymerase sigma factor [Hyphomicrobiales bacterium]|nr:sigma-70 family RNA polymerase sigma factor [Hyphomicrobiales bacterium]
MKRPSAEFRDALLASIPNMRAFAISLCGNHARADDLVQDVLVKAWSNIDKFQEGTNLKAWLFTILRNTYLSDRRKRRREVEDANGVYSDKLSSPPEQHGHLDVKDMRLALAKLSTDQREALVLIGAEGFSYEEAAEICGCAVGTIKSRVNRARHRLAELMNIEAVNDFGPEPITGAVMSQAAASSR